MPTVAICTRRMQERARRVKVYVEDALRASQNKWLLAVSDGRDVELGVVGEQVDHGDQVPERTERLGHGPRYLDQARYAFRKAIDRSKP